MPSLHSPERPTIHRSGLAAVGIALRAVAPFLGYANPGRGLSV